MKVATMRGPLNPFSGKRSAILMLAFYGFACVFNATGRAQDASAKPQVSAGEDADTAPAALSMTSTPEDRDREAWRMLTDAAGDAKHPQTRIQALAALGMLRAPQSEKTIVTAMADAERSMGPASAISATSTGSA